MEFEITVIQEAVSNNRHRFTLHALEKLIERDIAPDEIQEAILSGEIIETYPDDKYGPSCLVHGIRRNGEILHVHCSVYPVWIITAYNPALKPIKWDIHFKKTERIMKCIACHGKMESHTGEIELRINGRLFLVENAAYQQCPSCGERVLNPETSQEIFHKVRSKQYTQKHVVLPVVQSQVAMSA